MKHIFNDNTRILDGGYYMARRGKVSVKYGDSTLYGPERLDQIMDGTSHPSNAAPKIEVTAGTTGDTGRALAKETGAKVAILNFASGKRPGGGYVRGTKAQEEDLCRCSLLYHALLEVPDYYTANRASKTALYTDNIIYTRDVTFFRADDGYELLEEEETAELGVITAPAPNAGAARVGDDIEGALRRRAGYVLGVAHANGARNIVLGAWGCGVFKCDPEMVADAFATHLESDVFKGAFDRVVFAVYAASVRGQTNLEVFRRRFA